MKITIENVTTTKGKFNDLLKTVHEFKNIDENIFLKLNNVLLTVDEPIMSREALDTDIFDDLIEDAPALTLEDDIHSFFRKELELEQQIINTK